MFCNLQLNFLPDIVDKKYRMSSVKGFQRRDLDALFLRNETEMLLIIGIVAFAYALSKLALMGVNKDGFPHRFFKKIVSTLEYGGLLCVFQMAVMGMGVFSALQLKN